MTIFFLYYTNWGILLVQKTYHDIDGHVSNTHIKAKRDIFIKDNYVYFHICSVCIPNKNSLFPNDTRLLKILPISMF